MAIHAPITGANTRAHISWPLSRGLRLEIEREVERLIALLDAADGDCDLEDDDPSGDPLDLVGEASSDDGRGLLLTRPVWALDQTEGPVNHHQAQREYLAAEMGLVRSPAGRFTVRS